MNENRIPGIPQELGGNVQGVAGELTGDRETRSKGNANEVEGDAEKLYGQAEIAVRDVAESGGDLAQDAIRMGISASSRLSTPKGRGAMQ